MVEYLDGVYMRKQGHKSSIDAVLNRLLIEQKAELGRYPFAPESFDRRKPVLSEFNSSSRFRKIYDQSMRFHLMPHSDEELKKYRDYFAGKLFEEIAYSLLSGMEFPGRIVLSPDRTVHVYRAFYPGMPITSHFFGVSIGGISVPDGMMFEVREGIERIVAVCEYTLFGHPSYFDNKYQSFNKTQRKFEQRFADTNLMFVVPKEAHVPSSIRYNKAVKVQELPFVHSQFRDFVDNVYNRYRIENNHYRREQGIEHEHPTLAEAQAMARREYERGVHRLIDGTLTPEYAGYLKSAGGPNAIPINKDKIAF